MSRKTNILTNLRNARIERILSSAPGGLLVSRTFRRFLCVIAVLFSYLYLATLLIPAGLMLSIILTKGHAINSLAELNGSQMFLLVLEGILAYVRFLSPVILLVVFLLLRRSMRRVTSLPDQYLDEREIANRDWAFKTGYLVVRRIGFGAAIVFFVINVMGFTPGRGKYSPQEDSVIAVDNFNKYLISLVSNNAVGFVFTMVALLTYVAYSFPLILVAWRESKFSEPIPKPVVMMDPEGPAKLARQYFRRIIVIVSFIVAYTLITFSSFFVRAFGNWLTFQGGLFYMIFAFVFYAMYVYIWASIKTVGVLNQTRRNKYNEGKDSAAALGALIFFVITQCLGVALLFAWPVVLSNPGISANPIVLLFGLGLAMIPAQIISFLFIRRIGKAKAAEVTE